MTSFNDKLLTVAETAKALSLAPPTIRLWVGQRRIGHVRLGGAIRIKTSEVERILEAGDVSAARSRTNG